MSTIEPPYSLELQYPLRPVTNQSLTYYLSRDADAARRFRRLAAGVTDLADVPAAARLCAPLDGLVRWAKTLSMIDETKDPSRPGVLTTSLSLFERWQARRHHLYATGLLRIELREALADALHDADDWMEWDFMIACVPGFFPNQSSDEVVRIVRRLYVRPKSIRPLMLDRRVRMAVGLLHNGLGFELFFHEDDEDAHNLLGPVIAQDLAAEHAASSFSLRASELAQSSTIGAGLRSGITRPPNNV